MRALNPPFICLHSYVVSKQCLSLVMTLQDCFAFNLWWKPTMSGQPDIRTSTLAVRISVQLCTDISTSDGRVRKIMQRGMRNARTKRQGLETCDLQ